MTPRSLPSQAQKHRDNRASTRFDSVMPIEMQGVEGWTRNISSTGVYFETDASQEVGSRVNLTLEFTLEGKHHRLLCEGEVVRVDQASDRVGVAARLLTPFFAAADPVRDAITL